MWSSPQTTPSNFWEYKYPHLISRNKFLQAGYSYGISQDSLNLSLLKATAS